MVEIFLILQLFLVFHNPCGGIQIVINLAFPHSFPFHNILQFQLVYHSCPVAVTQGHLHISQCKLLVLILSSLQTFQQFLLYGICCTHWIEMVINSIP